jgi:FkbM family methyltransferase
MNPNQIQQAFGQLQQSIYQLFLQQTRLRQRVYAVEAAARCRDAGRAPALPMEFTSQFGEDCLIWDAFNGQLDGFFIEVGAFDGYGYSVTYPLEAAGWKGLLIEGIPERAEQCAKRRPHSRTVHAACTAPGAPAELTFKVVSDQYGGMLSYVAGNHDHHKLMTGQGRQIRDVKVPTTTMNTLLEGHPGGPPSKIDVASIDVESHEIELLKGFDLWKWKPRLLLIEDDAGKPRADITEYMQGQPYEWVGMMQCSRVLVHKGEPELAERVKRVLNG